MTITSTTNKVSYAGDDATVSFPITFIFWDDTDIRVILRDSAGAETVWVDGTQYTLTGGNGATGTLTVDTSPTDYTPATGETLVIKSNRDVKQEVDIVTGGVLPSASIEEGLDKNVRLVQQKDEELDRAVKFAESSPTSDITFPEPTADSLVGWNAAGTDLANIEVGDVTAFQDILFTSKATGDMIRFNGTNWVNRTAAQTRSDLSVPGLATANTFAEPQVFSKTQTGAKGADLASAATLTLGTDGNYFDVTGTTAITAINGVAGTHFFLQFDGSLTFTDGASLTLPGNANIPTAAGDIAEGWMLSTTVANIVNYRKADGTSVLRKPGTPVQIVNTSSSSNSTTTTAIAVDGGVPTITEGAEFMTRAITPNSSSNLLRIDVVVWGTNTATADNCVAALFQDATSLSLNVGITSIKAAGVIAGIQFTHWMTAGTTSSTTFRVRAGSNTGATFSFNPQTVGSTITSSITITEIQA